MNPPSIAKDLIVHLSQLNFIIGDLSGNLEKIRQDFNENNNVDVIVYSELALTGYPPNDLLHRKGFVDRELEMLDEIQEWTADSDVLLLIGAVTKANRGRGLYNSVIGFQRGRRVFHYNKQLLPTYNIFDENRYFEMGCGDQRNVFPLQRADGSVCQIGVLVCEDAWNDEAVTKVPLYVTNPWVHLMEQKPDVVITLNASPSHVGKYLERYDMYCRLAKRYKTSIVYVNQVGGNDALIFDGGSFVAYYDKEVNKAAPIRMSLFVEEGLTLNVLQGQDLYKQQREWDILMAWETRKKAAQIFQHLVLGVRDYVTKNGFKKVVVGSSGGIDSAVVLAIAVEALGSNNVEAITMPSKVSSAGSVDDSVDLCHRLGVKLYTYSIEEAVDNAIHNYEQAFGKAPARLTIENIQPRERGKVLMAFSNDTGALVLSTGNKSEMSVGYCTLYGDMCGGLAVIADVYKMEVYEIAKYYNQLKGGAFIPLSIIDKEPSAELWDNQKDTDSLPPYPVLDAVLHLYLERDLLSREEIAEYTAICEQINLGEIKRILKLCDKAEFKRQQAPPVLRIHRRAFGFGRNLPITQKFEVDYRNVL